MPPITRQQNNSKKTPYNGASIEENTQKPPKKVKNQHNNNNIETRSKNHVTMTRDVTPNASTSNNNNSNLQAIPEYPNHPNSNDEDLELDTDDWTDIQYNTRHKIFIPMEKTELKKRVEKRKEMENLIPGHIRIVGSDIKFADDTMYIKIDFPTATNKVTAVEHLDKIKI